MRKILKLSVCVLFLINSGSILSSPSQPNLISGTYQSGDNLTEPRPQKGIYIKTNMGGFQIVQGFAGYKLFIDVIKHPEQRLYSRTIVENPIDPSSPFIYDYHLDPTTPNTTLTHGPVKGLKIHHDYKITYILFEDEAREKEVDRIEQKIRSYIDTTGPKLLVYENLESK